MDEPDNPLAIRVVPPGHKRMGPGLEAKSLAGVQGVGHPEAPRFYPYLRTKISILRPHFYFSEFFIIIIQFFSCCP